MTFSVSKKKFRVLLAAATIFLILGVSVYLFLFTNPQTIVRQIGTENAYMLLFVTSVFAGITTGNLVPYHILLITLAAGGLNILYLGLVAAIGVSIGDSTSYYLGYQGRAVLSERMGKFFGKLSALNTRHPRLFMFVCFCYSAVIPSSNDLITIPAGLARLPFWRIMIPLFLGNIFFDVVLAYLAANSFDIPKIAASIF